MDFRQYQEKSRETAIYPDVGRNWVYPALGLGGEVGEIQEKMKKVMRDREGYIDSDLKALLEKELGDVLWYLSQLASELGLSLEDIAINNIKKLRSRQKRGKLQGSGDER